MDYRSAYIRRSRKGSRLKQRAAAFALAAVAGAAVLFALAMRESVPPAAAAQERTTAGAAALASAVLRTAAQVEAQDKQKQTRRIYPYSIVPGGLADRQELARAIVRDKVVATHYAAFEAARATVETVRKPRAVYVSYRKGNQVYWTARKLQLAAGETLLSDGHSEIRTRCGNRISDVPQLPVEATGPSEEELDTSVDVAADDAGEGSVQQVGFAVQDNPAGQGNRPQSFGSGGTAQHGAASQSGSSRTRSGAGFASLASSGLGAVWDGGTLPLALAGKVSGDTAHTGGAATETAGAGTPETRPPDPGTTSAGTSSTGTSVTGTTANGTIGTGTPGTGTTGTQPPSTGTSGKGPSSTNGSKPGGSTTGDSKTGGSKPGGSTTGGSKTGGSAAEGSNTAAPIPGGSDTGSAGDTSAGGSSSGTAKSGTTDDTTSGTTSGTTADSGTQPAATPPEPALPPIAADTKPSPLPDTLLPPTTDLPGPTSDPAKAPTKHADVPEPGTPWLGGAGVVALLAARRAKKRTAT